MSSAPSSDPLRALAHLKSGLYVMTAQFETKRSGIVVRSVQAAAEEPPLVCVAVRRGHWIEPIIRDSHCFGVSKVGTVDRLLLRKFAETARPRDGDPFDCLPTVRLTTGAPILAKTSLALDCEVFRHIDIEADHELYIGLVVAARSGTPADETDPGQPVGAGQGV